MSSPATALTPASINLQPSSKPSFTATGDPAAIMALVNNGALPANDVTLGQVGAQLSTGKDLQLPGVKGDISFKGSGSVFSNIAAYTNGNKLAAELLKDADAQSLGVDFGADAASRLLVLRWGFDASASATGKMALSPYSTIDFGASASADGLFAFIQRVPEPPHARDAFESLLESWCTPMQVANQSKPLPPNTWIITEVSGELKANVGATAGYDFNWVKTLKLNDLDGDIGLRISLGLQASLTASLAGKYYMVLNREGANSGTRLRLFRSTTKGWGFALHAGADVALSTGSLLPDNLEDFIKAIFGIHDAQLIKFLKASSVADITDALGGKFLADLRLDGDVSKAFTDVQAFLAKWDNLPHEVTTVLWKYAAKIPELAAIRDAAKTISQLSDDSIRTFLDGLLHDAGFPDNPVVQWLEAMSSQALFQLYESNQLATLREDVKKVTEVLDGSDVEDLLQKLKTKVAGTLDFPLLEQAVTAGSLAGVAKWVAEQLSKFLGVDFSQVNASIAKIDAVIKAVKGKADSIYAATRKALNNTYGFSLDYAYNASTLNSALIDVEFSDATIARLGAAIHGDFTDILTVQIPGITLRRGTLTHGIERHSHAEVHLPWWTGTADDLVKGSATANFVDAEGGRVQFYEASASSTHVDTVKTNLRRYANLSIGISGATTGVRQYNVKAVDFGYNFMTLNKAMTRSQFKYEFGPVSDTYFKGIFGDGNPDPRHATFDEWVVSWDKFTDQAPGLPAGDGVIGNTWANLQLRSRANEGVDWVSALLNGTGQPDYFAMSKALQKSIRHWLFECYSSNPDQFKNMPGNNIISAFLIYFALPGLNDFRFDGVSELTPVRGKEIVWDVLDMELLKAVVPTFGEESLQAMLNSIADLLAGIPELKNNAKFYRIPARTVFGFILKDPVRTDPFPRLLQWEKTLIDGAKSAFEDLRKAGSQNLHNALPALSAALVDLVTTFNSNLGTVKIDGSSLMRYFGPMVFQSAIEAMFPRAATLNTDALLEVAVLNTTSLPETNDPPAEGTVLLKQRITSFA